MDWMGPMQECPVFHPTEEEFSDPLAYISKISATGKNYGTSSRRAWNGPGLSLAWAGGRTPPPPVGAPSITAGSGALAVERMGRERMGRVSMGRWTLYWQPAIAGGLEVNRDGRAADAPFGILAKGSLFRVLFASISPTWSPLGVTRA